MLISYKLEPTEKKTIEWIWSWHLDTFEFITYDHIAATLALWQVSWIYVNLTPVASASHTLQTPQFTNHTLTNKYKIFYNFMWLNQQSIELLCKFS